MTTLLDICRKGFYHVSGHRYLLIYLGLYFIIAPTVTAHGGGTPQLINADIGPYWISTWVRPYPPETENFHLTVALSEPTDPTAALREAGPPVLNASVEVQLQSVVDPTLVVSAMATHDQAVNKFLYEADLTLPFAGQWQGQILVEGPDSGSGNIAFGIEVVNGTTLNIPMLIAAGLILLLAVWWLMRRTIA